MRAILFLLVLNALLFTCLSTLPSLKTQQTATKRGYALHTPEGLGNTRYLVRSLPTAPVSVYKYPYNSINNNVTAPNINRYVIPQNNYVKNFYDKEEKLLRSKLFYDSLAKQLNKELVRKSKIPTPNYKLADRNIHRTSFAQNPSHIQKYIINKGYNPNFISSRRTELEYPITKYENNGKTYELNEDGRNHYKKVMYLMSDPERSNVESKSPINFKNESSEDYNNLEPLNIHEVSVRRNEPRNIIDQYYLNEDLSHVPFEDSDADLNNNEYHDQDFDASLRRPFTFQPAFGLLHPIKGLTNKIKQPMHNHMKFKTDLTHYSLKHLHMPQITMNDNYEWQIIKTYLAELMRSENYNNPIIIQILHDANDLDLSKLDLLDQSQLVKLSEIDLQYLKRYFVMILNKYGLTPYILKLLEYINLIEGKPKNETYLLFKILTNQQAVNNLSPVELSQIKQHLQQILNEYGQSPYILAFIQNIKGINIDPINNNNLFFLDVNNHVASDYVTQEDMTRIYLYLIQFFKNNPLVLKIIQNVNEIYENPNREIFIPLLDISSYQSLANLNQNDLDLLVKYIIQIIKQRGENWYLNQLLFYINQIRGILNKDINVTLVYDNQNIYQENQEELSNGLYQEILQILKPLTNKIPNGDQTQEPVNLSADDLIKIKNILLQIKNKNEVNPILIDISQLLNQVEKKQEKHFDLQPIVLDISKNTIDMNLHDMEQIYKYLQNLNNVKDNSHIVKIAQLIKQTQNQNNSKDKNGVIKIKYNDLAELYNYLLQSHKEDTENPIFIKILQYISQNKDNVQNTNNNTISIITLNDTDKMHAKEINLDEIYKFILNRYETDKSNPLLSDIIQHINKTLILPNDQLKIKETLNNTQSQDNINPNNLEIIYSILQKLKENNELNTELLEYIDNNKNVKKYEPKPSVISYANRDALDRIKKFLLTLVKEQGEVPYVIQILLDINRVQGIPESNNNQQLLVINDTVTEVNEDDLQILSEYLTKIINEVGESPDVRKILEYVYEAQEKIKAEKKDQNKQNPIDLYILQIINNMDISPEVVDILRFINSDNWNNHYLEIIENLKEDDLNVLRKYLQQIITHFGPSSRIKEISDYINKINEKANHNNDKINIYFNNTHLNDNDKQNQKPIKTKPEVTKEQYMLEITKEINILLEHGVMQLIQNIHRDNLNTLYNYILQNIFISPNTLESNDLPSILTRLINSYKQEVYPVNKYILLKLYEYILKNVGVPLGTFWQPGFINVLLDLNDAKQNKVRPYTIHEQSDKKYFVVRPYDYTQDIESALKKLIQKTTWNQLNANNLIEENKNLLTNYTIYEISDNEPNNIIKNSKNIKDGSCVAADRKFTIILKLLNNMFHLNEHKIDLTMKDLEKMFDIFIIFMKRLSLEKYGRNIPMSALIQELQNRLLLQQHAAGCHHHPNIAQALMSRLIGNLQGIVSYLKGKNYSNDKITDIIVSLVETVLPDLSSINVKDCKSRTTKALMDSLYSIIYLHEPQANEIQFVSGQVAQGNSAKDFLQTLSMQELLKEIARYKTLFHSVN